MIHMYIHVSMLYLWFMDVHRVFLCELIFRHGYYYEHCMDNFNLCSLCNDISSRLCFRLFQQICAQRTVENFYHQEITKFRDPNFSINGVLKLVNFLFLEG